MRTPPVRAPGSTPATFPQVPSGTVLSEVARRNKLATETAALASTPKRSLTASRTLASSCLSLSSIKTATTDDPQLLGKSLRHLEDYESALRDATRTLDAEVKAEKRRRMEQDRKWEQNPEEEDKIAAIKADRAKVDEQLAARRCQVIQGVKANYEVKIKAARDNFDQLAHTHSSDPTWKKIAECIERTEKLFADAMPAGTVSSAVYAATSEDSLTSSDDGSPSSSPPLRMSPELARKVSVNRDAVEIPAPATEQQTVSQESIHKPTAMESGVAETDASAKEDSTPVDQVVQDPIPKAGTETHSQDFETLLKDVLARIEESPKEITSSSKDATDVAEQIKVEIKPDPIVQDVDISTDSQESDLNLSSEITASPPEAGITTVQESATQPQPPPRRSSVDYTDPDAIHVAMEPTKLDAGASQALTLSQSQASFAPGTSIPRDSLGTFAQRGSQSDFDGTLASLATAELITILEASGVMKASQSTPLLLPSKQRLFKRWAQKLTIKKTPSASHAREFYRAGTYNGNKVLEVGAVFGRAIEDMMADEAQVSSGSIEAPLPAPAIVIKLVDMLRNEKAMSSVGIFRSAPNGPLVRDVIAKLNDGEDVEFPIPGVDAYDYAAILKAFFRETKEPLLMHRFFKIFNNISEITDESSKLKAVQCLVALLPHAHKSTLRYLMEFLAVVASNAHKNRMNAQNLAIVVGPNILRRIKDPTEKVTPKTAKMEAKTYNSSVDILTFMLENVDALWELPLSITDQLKNIPSDSSTSTAAALNNPAAAEADSPSSDAVSTKAPAGGSRNPLNPFTKFFTRRKSF
ncbi:Rho GTPase-activating protein 1 [Borealophlyctis nickersoniae]|nr:Rho GTPase-activating protein 1 [Borealophlyctis nickersoniae]